jgi:hypothetical protein
MTLILRAVVAGMAWAVLSITAAHATATSPTPSWTSCTSEALESPFTSLHHIDAYGCEGNYAWVWATVGDAAHPVSVTEILVWIPEIGHWQFTNRAVVCRENLPPYVERFGCHSN